MKLKVLRRVSPKRFEISTDLKQNYIFSDCTIYEGENIQSILGLSCSFNVKFNRNQIKLNQNKNILLCFS